MQRGAGGRDLGEPALDCGVDVLIRVEELEGTCIELFADTSQPPLDRSQLCGGDDAGGSEAARVRDAARDVEGVQLEVGVKRRRESLELDQQTPLEAATPQFAVGGCAGYFPSRLTSPNRLPSSRACRRPWTCADVRTPIPHSLMKPAAADWSNTSPLP
jgi:hypothetical protein